MEDFTLLKKFGITLHPTRVPRILEVIWHPPVDPWIECNSDGCSIDTSSSCGGIFRNASADMLLCIAENIGDGNAFQAELIGAMRAIETAHQNSWNHLWLEHDSAMVLHALKANIQMPCNLRNIWNNCKHMIKSMIFFLFLMYLERETNVQMDFPTFF